MHRVSAIAVVLVLAELLAGGLPRPVSALDCGSFAAQEDAQAVFDANPGDRFGLDPDGNGVACDDIPARSGQPATIDSNEDKNGSSADTIPEGAIRAEVVDVIDGDTFAAQIGHKLETIRLLGIDAPEIRDTDGPVECFGAEATERARQLLAEGRTVYLEDEDAGRDAAGRLLRYAWIDESDGDARLVNLVLVRRGFAVVTDPPARVHGSRIQNAQDRAIAGEEGLWSACGGADTPLTAKPRQPSDSPFEDPPAADVDLFWMQAFAAVAEPYAPPNAVVDFSADIDTACGHATARDAAFYCPLDQTIYYSAEFRRDIVKQAGEFAWATVLAHEWGHHIQAMLVFGANGGTDLMAATYPIAMELQADCLAGVYARDVEARGEVDSEQIATAEALIGMVGDPDGTRWYDPGAHGGSEQRVRSFRQGYADGLAACDIAV